MRSSSGLNNTVSVEVVIQRHMKRKDDYACRVFKDMEEGRADLFQGSLCRKYGKVIKKNPQSIACSLAKT
jgi:hypothetical protein